MSRLATAFGSVFMETSYVARVYGDSLRDNFVGYVPTDGVAFAELKQDFDAEIAKPLPYLAELLRIKAALIETMPDVVVKARFWAIDDRFRRVVPLATCDRYDKSVPGRGDACWQAPAFLRDQTRTLLDVIHANYLINIGREKSVKRLKVIISLSILVIIGLALLTNWLAGGTPMAKGLLLLAGAGIFGSTLSIINRLQTATQVDAMTQDGIYELTGLRVGWVGVLMSFVLGGGFALVLYFVVMGGVLDVAFPRFGLPPEPAGNATADAREGNKGEAIDASANTSVAMPSPATNTAEQSPKPSPSADAMREAARRAMQPAKPTGSDKAIRQADGKPPKDPKTADHNALATCTGTLDQPCVAWANRVGIALGFRDTQSFFKMLILAFLAGFAERLVPDILNRLSKQPSRSA